MELTSLGKAILVASLVTLFGDVTLAADGLPPQIEKSIFESIFHDRLFSKLFTDRQSAFKARIPETKIPNLTAEARSISIRDERESKSVLERWVLLANCSSTEKRYEASISISASTGVLLQQKYRLPVDPFKDVYFDLPAATLAKGQREIGKYAITDAVIDKRSDSKVAISHSTLVKAHELMLFAVKIPVVHVKAEIHQNILFGGNYNIEIPQFFGSDEFSASSYSGSLTDLDGSQRVLTLKATAYIANVEAPNVKVRGVYLDRNDDLCAKNRDNLDIIVVDEGALKSSSFISRNIYFGLFFQKVLLNLRREEITTYAHSQAPFATFKLDRPSDRLQVRAKSPSALACPIEVVSSDRRSLFRFFASQLTWSDWFSAGVPATPGYYTVRFDCDVGAGVADHLEVRSVSWDPQFPE